MKFFVPVAAALALATSAVAQLTVNTPVSVVVCQPLLITWTGGTPPYFLFRLLPGGQPSADALIDFGTLDTTQVTWVVNITAGTSLGLTLRDSTGAISQSAPFPVQASSDTSCLDGPPSPGSSTSASSGSTSGSSSSTTGSTGVTTSPTTAPTSATSATSRSTSVTSPAASASSPAPSTDDGSQLVAQIGLAGAAGAAIIAFFA